MQRFNGRRSRRTISQPGFFLIDAIFALGIILLLAGLLAVAMKHQQRAATQFGDSRDAVRLAERTLAAIQVAQPPPAPPIGSTIQIRPLESAKNSPGLRWVSVHVQQHGRSVLLVGIAPLAPRTPPPPPNAPTTMPVHISTAPAATQGAHP